MIYNDYTNLNEQLIKEYRLDLKPFYVRSEDFGNVIKEIPMNEIDKIMDKTIEIIEESKVTKDLVFDVKIQMYDEGVNPFSFFVRRFFLRLYFESVYLCSRALQYP